MASVLVIDRVVTLRTVDIRLVRHDVVVLLDSRRLTNGRPRNVGMPKFLHIVGSFRFARNSDSVPS